MMGTSSGRKWADIKVSVEKNSDIIEEIMPLHELSGCDTLSALWA